MEANNNAVIVPTDDDDGHHNKSRCVCLAGHHSEHFFPDGICRCCCLWWWSFALLCCFLPGTLVRAMQMWEIEDGNGGREEGRKGRSRKCDIEARGCNAMEAKMEEEATAFIHPSIHHQMCQFGSVRTAHPSIHFSMEWERFLLGVLLSSV